MTQRPTVKLEAELVPRNLWGANLRSELSRKEWDNLRKRCYKRANFRCEICNGVGKKHPVEAHEVWEYDDQNYVQKLVGITALCPSCHRVKHIGRTLGTPYKWATIAHFKRINSFNEYELESYLNQVFGVWSTRSQYQWRQDYSELKNIIESLNGFDVS